MNTILLVDDHMLFLEGMRSLIADWEDFDVVGTASNGREAVELCRNLMPDLVLMDINMPELNGLQATEIIGREMPATNVVILTMSEKEKYLFEAIKAGARGYILKDTPVRRLHDQLRGVMRGDAALSGPIAAKMLQEFNRNKKGKKGVGFDQEPLTEREVNILQYIVEGLSNQEIADKLVISEQTVKKHLSNILQKLHLNNRVQIAVYALREGLSE